MMEPAPSPSLEVTDPHFLLELLVIPLDAPTQFREVDQAAEADLLRKGRKPIPGWCGFAFWPLDQQPLVHHVFRRQVRIADTNPQGRPRSHAHSSCLSAISCLVSKLISAGTPALSRRASSSAHSRGRYSRYATGRLA